MSHRHEPAGRKRKDVWAGLNPALYRGRGQTFAKHVLLKQYLQELAFKVLQSPRPPPDFLYLDGFSGPWQSHGESFEDTSFSIALTILTEVREVLASKGRFPQMRAVFVEERAEAVAQLEEAVKRFPRIEVEVLRGRLEDKVAEIQGMLRAGTFLFAFLDPCGWKGMALNRIAPLLSHRPGEVLVNVMLDSLRRHVTFEGASESAGEFFGGGAWRSEMDEAKVRLGSREAAILDVYLRRLMAAGGFTYVATTRVRDPDAARTYFHLAYGTRHPAGIEVFRRCEKRCVEIQEKIVVESYHERRERDQGVQDLFRQAGDESFAAFSKWKDDSRARAKAEFDEWLKAGKTDHASHRRAVLMQHPHVDAALVNCWVHEAVQAGLLRREVDRSNEVWIPLGTAKGAKHC